MKKLATTENFELHQLCSDFSFSICFLWSFFLFCILLTVISTDHLLPIMYHSSPCSPLNSLHCTRQVGVSTAIHLQDLSLHVLFLIGQVSSLNNLDWDLFCGLYHCNLLKFWVLYWKVIYHFFLQVSPVIICFGLYF